MSWVCKIHAYGFAGSSPARPIKVLYRTYKEQPKQKSCKTAFKYFLEVSWLAHQTVLKTVSPKKVAGSIPVASVIGNKLLQLACKRIAEFVIRAVRKAVYPADF